MNKTARDKTYIRARNSVRKFKGAIEDYYPIHEWFYVPSHLAMRHHAQGIFEAEKKFGVVIHTSDGRKMPTRVICEEHIKQEIGFIPTAQEWITHMELHKWMGYRDKGIIRYAKSQTTTKEKPIQN